MCIRDSLHVVSLIAERLLDGNGLVLFIQRGRGAVRVDIVNVSRGQTGILDGAADGVRRCFAVRRRASDCLLYTSFTYLFKHGIYTPSLLS